MAKIIGTVKSISGKVNMTTGAKQVHPLKIGEPLHENDIIQTLQANAKVVLRLEGGREIILDGNDQILLDESVFAVLEEGEVINAKALHQLISDKLGNPEETAAGETITNEANAGAEYASRNDTRGSAGSSGAFSDDGSSSLGVNFNATQNENFAPEAFDDTAIAIEEGSGNPYKAPVIATGNVLDNDTDDLLPNPPADLDVTAVISNDSENPTDFAEGIFTVQGLYGTLILNAETGEYTYTADDENPAVDRLSIRDTLSESFTYVVSDGGLNDSAVLTITINGANDQPVVSDVNANSSGDGDSAVGLDTLTSATISISSFGESATDYYAQSFTATESNLNNVQFRINDYSASDDTTNFHVLVTELIQDSSGLRPGAILFESETLSTNNGQSTNFSVDLSGLNLTVGSKYAIVFDSEISFNGLPDYSTVAAGYNIDPNGDFFYLNSNASSDRATDFNVANWSEWINSYDMGLILTYGSGAAVIFETNSTQTISPEYTLLELSNLIDSDTTDTHTFQLASDTVPEVSSSSEATITDLQVLITDENTGAYSVTGNFDHLAAGETATVTFAYTVTDNSGADNAISEAKTVTLTITGTNDQPVISDIDVNATGSSETGTVLHDVHNIASSGQVGSVEYTYFTIHESTNLSIAANSTGGNFMDTYIYLLKADGTLSTDDYITSNDDYYGLNSYLNITLQPGEYVVALGGYPLSLDEVISGINGSYYGNAEGTLTFTANHPITLHDSNLNVIYETNGIETVSPEHTLRELSGLTDMDTTDTHTFQLATGTLPEVTTDSGATITDLQVEITDESTGAYSVSGNFDALAEGETATVTFQYVANDGKGFDGTDGINESSISAPKTVTLTVTGTNDTPIAIASDTIAIEDTIITGNVSASDLDNGETSTLTYTLIDSAPVGLTFHPNGSYTFDANSYDYLSKDETLELKIAFTATDIHNAISSASYLTIKVVGTNDTPIAVNDAVTEAFTVSNVNYGGSNGWNGVTITAIGGTLVNNGQLGVRANTFDDRSIDNTGNDESVQLKFSDVLLHAEVKFSGFNTQLIDLAGRDTAIWTAMMGTAVIATGTYTGGDDSTLVIDTGTRVFDTLIIGTPSGSGSDFYIDSLQGYKVDIDSALTLMKNTALTIEESYLIDNDTDIDQNDIINITAIDSTGTVGEVYLDTNGNVIYDPAGRFDHIAAGEIAHDTFTYTLSDGIDQNTATVTVNIIGSNSANDGSTTMFASSISDFDGGDGYDSVTLMSIFNNILDFDNVSSKLHNIEHLDLNSLIGNITLKDITPDNVANMTDSDHVLKISGEADDVLELSGFTLDPNTSANLEGYNVYTGIAAGHEITLHVDQDITNINIIP